MIQPKAVFFDLDETLIENSISVTDVFARMYTDFIDELGEQNRKVFFNELRHRAQTLWNGMFETQESPESQLIECFQLCINSTNTVNPERTNALAKNMFEHFLDLSANNVRFHDDTEHVLQALRERGFVTGVITNGVEQIQMSKINKLNITDKVDLVTVSAQARAHKPQQAVFDLAAERAGIPHHQSWMIGDHPTNDVAGGMRAGMTGIYYNPRFNSLENAFADLIERPHFTINKLSEILELIQPT